MVEGKREVGHVSDYDLIVLYDWSLRNLVYAKDSYFWIVDDWRGKHAANTANVRYRERTALNFIQGQLTSTSSLA